MCCFCSVVTKGGKLKTHKNTHKEVATILQKTTNEQNKWFENKRTEGMYKYNLAHLTDSELMRERKPKKLDEFRMCMKCKKTFFFFFKQKF